MREQENNPANPIFQTADEELYYLAIRSLPRNNGELSGPSSIIIPGLPGGMWGTDSINIAHPAPVSATPHTIAPYASGSPDGCDSVPSVPLCLLLLSFCKKRQSDVTEGATSFTKDSSIIIGDMNLLDKARTLQAENSGSLSSQILFINKQGVLHKILEKGKLEKLDLPTNLLHIQEANHPQNQQCINSLKELCKEHLRSKSLWGSHKEIATSTLGKASEWGDKFYYEYQELSTAVGGLLTDMNVFDSPKPRCNSDPTPLSHSQSFPSTGRERGGSDRPRTPSPGPWVEGGGD